LLVRAVNVALLVSICKSMAAAPLVGGFAGDKLPALGDGGGWVASGPFKRGAAGYGVVGLGISVARGLIPDKTGGGFADSVGGGHGVRSLKEKSDFRGDGGDCQSKKQKPQNGGLDALAVFALLPLFGVGLVTR
jgi:hypothetical protein